MSMYNCFSNEMPSNFEVYVTVDSSKQLVSLFSSTDSLSKVYMIPVKFNQEYTIGLNSSDKIEMFAGFYEEGNLRLYDLDATKTYMKRSGCSFRNVFVYKKLTNLDLTDKLLEHEDNLYL